MKSPDKRFKPFASLTQDGLKPALNQTFVGIRKGVLAGPAALKSATAFCQAYRVVGFRRSPPNRMAPACRAAQERLPTMGQSWQARD
jgi:hypothetical protein